MSESDVENERQKRRRPKQKITDYFAPTRRSERKINQRRVDEEQKKLAKMILDGVQDGIGTKMITGKGRGIVALRKFARNEFVVEYSGELLEYSEAKAREAKYSKDTNAGCYMYFFKYRNYQWCVDATAETDRLGRLVNHSRCGNLVTRVVDINGTPRLVLVARRDIEEQEELSYDYGDRRREALRQFPWLAN